MGLKFIFLAKGEGFRILGLVINYFFFDFRSEPATMIMKYMRLGQTNPV